MGYCSNIIVVINKTVYLDFVVLKQNRLPVLLRERAEQIAEDGHQYFMIENIKYYDDYPEVKELDKFLSDIESEFDGEAYGFVRTGEEEEDIEIRGQPYNYDVYAQTLITSPVGSI